MELGRRLAPLSIGVACGMAAGAVAAIWARVAMRMVALGVADNVGVRPEFTLPGTLVILGTGVILGAAAGAVYAVVAGRLPGPARWHGLVFAAILLVVVGPLFFRTEEFFSTGRVLLFIPPFVLFGIVLAVGFAPARRVMSALPNGAQATIALAGLGTFGLLLFTAAATALGINVGFVM